MIHFDARIPFHRFGIDVGLVGLESYIEHPERIEALGDHLDLVYAGLPPELLMLVDVGPRP